MFYDKEWLTVDNNPGSPHYGRAYLTTSRFLNGQQGAYAESPIWLSWSDDGGLTWSTPREISGSHPSCTFQDRRRRGTDCDEDQFSVPEVASDGTLYVHFLNGQNEAAWEVPEDLDDQILDGAVDQRRRELLAAGAGRTARGRLQRHAVVGHRQHDRVGPPDPLDRGGQHLGEPVGPARRHGRVVGPRDAQSERDGRLLRRRAG